MKLLKGVSLTLTNIATCKNIFFNPLDVINKKSFNTYQSLFVLNK